jgi:hypothetical protein
VRQIIAAVVAAFLLGILMVSTGAAETESPKLGIRPVSQDGSYFTLEIPAGETQEMTFEVGNFGEQPVDAIVYPADVYTLNNGGFGAGLDGEPTTGVTTWLDYSREQLSIEPGTAVRRTATIAVPGDTPPGEYITALVVQNANPVDGGSGAFSVDQIIRQAIAVAIDVPGPRDPNLTIGDATYSEKGGVSSIAVALENTGNVHLKPAGDFVVRDVGGAVVLEQAIAMDTFYAGMSTSLLVGMTSPLAPGEYTLELALGDEQAQLANQTRVLHFTVSAPGVDSSASPEASSVRVGLFTVTAARDALSQAVQYADIAIKIENDGDALDNVRVTLHVTRDGEPVEDFVLASSMSVTWGQTPVNQRYIPVGGWTPGVYAFTVSLEQVDPNTGSATLLATQTAEETIAP